MNAAEHVDVVAEAIYNAVTERVYHLISPTPWGDISGQDAYRRMAAAAIKALGLREENSYTSSPIPWLDKGVWERRLVSPWIRTSA